MAAMEHAIAMEPGRPTLWLIQVGLLQKAERLEDAVAAFGTVIELTRNRSDREAQRQSALQARSQLFKRLGCGREAQADFLMAHGIPPRPSDAGEQSIDLSAHYNVGLDANPRWDGVPRGMQTLAGVRFDILGWVKLLRISSKQPAASVTGIRVSQKCWRIHFLHGTGPPVPDGTVVARYVIHYADGQQTEVPIVYGQDVRDRAIAFDLVPTASRAVSVWPGANPDDHSECRLYCRSWQNLRTDAEVASIDFMACDVQSEPFLVALTVEP